MSKKKNKKGSALVVSLLVLFIILISALGIALTYLRERKASMANAKSNQAIQKVMTGIEEVKNDIISNNRRQVNEILNCDATTGRIITGDYEVEFLDIPIPLALRVQIPCDNPTALVSEIGALHSYGRSGQTERDTTVPMKIMSTKLLMHFNDDGGGSLDINDLSKNFHITTNYSTIPVVLDIPGQIGGGGASFPTGSYITVESVAGGANENDFNFLDKDFTIEAWVRMANADYTVGNMMPTIVNQWDGDGDNKQFRLYYDVDDQKLAFEYSTNGINNTILKSTNISRGDLIDSDWHNITVERKGGNVYFFFGGDVRGSDSIGSDNIFVTLSSKNLYVGASCISDCNNANPPALESAYQFIGSMDELRITKGMARWDPTVNFTPWVTEYSPNN